MTLSGNIESFPLSEVLRLAARARQSGLLRIESGGIHGRVYFTDGLLTYATTRDHDDLGGDLTQLGMIDPHKWYPVERGEEPIGSALAQGTTNEDVRRFLAERIADVLVRLLRSRHGRFDFSEEAQPTYVTGQRFEVEEVLHGVEARVREWTEIEATIPVENATIHMARDLGDRDTVSVDDVAWRILAALGSRSTVDGVADDTGLGDFVVAKTMADMVRKGLLEVKVASELDAHRERMSDSFSAGEPTPAPEAAFTDADAGQSPAESIAEDSSIVEFFKRPEDRSGTDGW